MSTEFNYVARLDTTQIMSGLSEIRSQVGMALQSPTGFMTPAMALAGGGFGQMGDISPVIGQQFRQMFAGMGSQQGSFGGTFTNPAIAYSPHYGMVQAQTTLGQELMVNYFGLNAAQRMKPPGVSSAEFALGVQSNFIDRQIDASHAAKMAAQSSFYAGVGGMAGGEVASALATPIGAAAGSALATRLLGEGAAGAGGMLGGLAAGYYAYNLASDFIGGRIENHFAKIERIEGVTRELGEIAGAGRGLKRTERVELGIAAHRAAGDLNMDVNEMGDILALSRENGMLPTATSGEKARTQFREFAKTIEEGAQILHTSLSNAMQVVKAASMTGMSSQEAIVRAAATGGFEQWAQLNAFGMQGAAVGRSMGFTGAQGSGVFMGALSSAGNAGLSWEEMRIMGGRFAAAQFIGQTQMGMATSPLGNAQLMAAMSGGNMSGMGLADMAGAALGGLSAMGGGDMMSNMGKFLVHQNELRRGIGARGIQTMAREQIEMGGELISNLMPGMTTNEAQRMYAMSMGMNPDQAKLFVGGITHSGGSGIGGGVGALGQMNAIDALQGSVLHGNFKDPGLQTGPSFGWGYAKEGALGGFAAGSLFGVGGGAGAIIGGIGGFIGGNASAMYDMLSGDGPGLFASAQEKADFYSRKSAAEYERRMDEAKARMGYVDIDRMAGSRFLRAGDLSGVRLDFDLAGSPVASANTLSNFMAMGLRPTRAGAGTIQVGGQYFSAAQVQAMGRKPLWDQQITQTQREATMGAAVDAAYGPGRDSRRLNQDINLFKMNYETVRLGSTPRGMFGNSWIGVENAGENLLPSAQRLIEEIDPRGSQGGERSRLLQKLNSPMGIADPEVRAYLEQVTGGFQLQSLQGAFMAGRAGAVSTAHTVDNTAQQEVSFLAGVYGHKASTLDPFMLGAGGISFVPTEDDTFAANAELRSVGRVYSAHGRETLVNNTLFQANDLNAKLMSTIRGSGAVAVRDRAYFDALAANPYYAAAKDAIVHGKDSEAKKLLHQARLDVLTSHGEQFRNLATADIDPTAQFSRPGAAAAGIMAHWIMTGARIAGASEDSLAKVDKELKKEILDKTTWKQHVLDEHESLKGLQPPRKKIGGMTGRPGTMERSIGFGEQESAMASIRRSLEHTESSLKALDKKISGPAAAPQQSANGQTTTGGYQ